MTKLLIQFVLFICFTEMIILRKNINIVNIYLKIVDHIRNFHVSSAFKQSWHAVVHHHQTCQVHRCSNSGLICSKTIRRFCGNSWQKVASRDKLLVVCQC